MKRSLVIALTGLAAAALPASQALASSHARGLQKYGYPVVLKTAHFKPGHAMKVTLPDQVTKGTPPGYATFSIPAHAFTKPVTIRFLAAKNSWWDMRVPKKLKVIANFAYLITNTRTGAMVKKFHQPIEYSVKDSMVTKDSVYWATTAHHPPKLINANKGSKIHGMTLSHATPVSFVGWIITTPKSELHMGMKKSMKKKSSSM